jgi:D-amino peptidase
MKIFISADFEGTCGVSDVTQCFPGNPDFELARRRWIGDINAIVEGVLAGGATQVVVNEAHAGMNYLLPEYLHPKAEYISGYVKVENQMEGLDASFRGAILMGHSMAGSEDGVLNHTYVMRDVIGLRLNGKPIGEVGLNAYWASVLGVPVILVVGDDKVAKEAQALLPEIETAIVKKGLSQFTAHHLPLDEARRVIRTAAERAMGRIPEIRGLPVLESYSLEIDFSLSEIAHLASFIPNVERIGSRTVRIMSPDYRQVQRLRIVCTNLALSVVRQHF